MVCKFRADMDEVKMTIKVECGAKTLTSAMAMESFRVSDFADRLLFWYSFIVTMLAKR